jgi:O-antigen/teichoic acid export membrane protein
MATSTRISWDTATFFAIGAIGKLATIACIAIAARSFPAKSFGAFDFYLACLAFASCIGAFGLDSALVRYYFSKETSHLRSSVLTSILSLQIMTSAIAIAVVMIGSLRFSSTSQVFGGGSGVLLALSLSVPFVVVYGTVDAFLRLTNRVKAYASLTFGYVLSMVGAVTFAARSGEVIHLIYAFSFVSIVFGVIACYFVHRDIAYNFTVNLPYRVIFGYSLPIFGVVITASFLPMAERAAALVAVGPDGLGTYGAAVRVVGLIAVLVASLQSAVFPIFFREGGFTAGSSIPSVAITTFGAILALGLVVVSTFSSSLVAVIVGDGYMASTILVFPLALAVCIQSCGALLSIGINLSGNTSARFINSLAGSALAVSAMWHFSTDLDLLAIALLALSGRLVTVLLDLCVARKLSTTVVGLWPTCLMFLVAVAVGVLKVKLVLTVSGDVVLFLVGGCTVACIWWFSLSRDIRTELLSFFSGLTRSLR